MDEVAPFDLRRMFLGEVDAWFLAEIVFRTAFMYLFTFCLVRVLSRRTASQLSIVELLLIIGLGSAVGDPMLYPDVPLLHGITIVTVVVFLHRGLVTLITRNERIEMIMEGNPIEVIRDGVLVTQDIRGSGIAADELFRMLRAHGVEHLGEVRLAYLEQDGSTSVFIDRSGRAGLAIVPPPELRRRPVLEAGEHVDIEASYACRRCGSTRLLDAGAVLTRCACDGQEWERAVETPRPLPR